MKKYNRYLLPVMLLILTGHTLHAQTINWGSLRETDRQIIHANVGAEYGIVYGAGYGYKLTGNRFPLVAAIEYSFPSGNQLLDDFKTKFGGQIRLAKLRDFQFSARAQGIFRRYENELVRLANWGMDLSGTIGYYRSAWFIAGEAGFDKAIATNFKHTNRYREKYPDVKDGWYQPATGGNFYYGLQTGISFRQHDITLKGGNLLTQDFKTRPTLPFYVQLGYNYRIARAARH